MNSIEKQAIAHYKIACTMVCSQPEKNLNQEVLSAKKVYFEFPITCLLFPTGGQLRQIYL